MRKVALASMVKFNVEEYFSTWKEVDAALVEVDRRLEASYPLPFARRVYNVLVEDLQNLFHHADFFLQMCFQSENVSLPKVLGCFALV